VDYRSIPTLREYLVIDQKSIHAVQYAPSHEGKWFLQNHNGAPALHQRGFSNSAAGGLR
jgi:Uma2 family endonuclease